MFAKWIKDNSQDYEPSSQDHKPTNQDDNYTTARTTTCQQNPGWQRHTTPAQ